MTIVSKRYATNKTIEQALIDSLNDLSILAGEVVGPSDVSWQDVAGTASINLRWLATLLDNARQGNCELPIVFPSPTELLGG